MKKILFIRRDNIGDLVCTTPAIRAAREKYPDAKIGVLVNTYNASILENNPDINEFYVYEKAKHVPEKNKLSVWWSNLKVLLGIRRERYDIAIGCGSYSKRLARYTLHTGAKERIGYLQKESGNPGSYTFPLYEEADNIHEVERTFNLLAPLGIKGTPPALRLRPSDVETERIRKLIQKEGPGKEGPLVAFHISSRRPENRWPADRFIRLGERIANNLHADILLLWSPGSERNPYHPGDDEKAGIIMSSLKPGPFSLTTTRLTELIAALSIADLVVCCDGGAMHIAAALGKPIVTIWGSTNPGRWKPWGAEHILLQTENKKAEDISVDTVLGAIEKILPAQL